MNTSVFTIVLILINLIVSYKGFRDFVFLEKYKFEVDAILLRKEYFRLITSGFLHVNWMHFIFNMISLYAFSEIIELRLGSAYFLLLYFASLLGGNLFSLFIHKNHGDYAAVGASGAVSGIIFASIAIFPETGVGLLFLPVFIPGWLFGILFTIYSIYGIRSNRDNIGHEAHLGGALVGMLVAVAILPSALSENYGTILIVTIPIFAFIFLIVRKPHFLLLNKNPFKAQKKKLTLDEKYNEERANDQRELDSLLEKIHRKGISSLSQKEKDKLEKLSR